ncbi:MAG: LPS export ABC transporter permease LptG [Thiotrichales bacterium]|nr:LPS export ABC transporter permease LptG [Thiotrichales bacterium]
MNRIERYLGRTLVSATLLVLMVLVSLLAFFEAIYQFGKLNEGYTFAKATLYVSLKLPGYVYELFPVALLIGTLMGLGALANHAELTILRVTGWSVRRILLAVAKSAFLLWLVVMLIGEFVAPQTESYAQKVRVEALNKSLSLGNAQGFWVKDGNRYINIGQVISAHELHRVTVYQFEQGRLQQVWRSPQVIYQPEQGWSMPQIQRLELNFTPLPTGITEALHAQNLPFLGLSQLQLHPKSLQNQPLAMPFTPDDLRKLDIDSRYLSVMDLYAYIRFLQQNELDSRRFELDFWRKLTMPLVAFAMLAIAFPLIFASQRQVSMGQRIFIGILIGLGFQLLNLLIGNLALVYQLPVALGAIAPAALLLAATLGWMQRLR